MLPRLLLLLALVQLLELVVLVQLARYVGVLPTLALVLGAGVLGGWLARLQGLRVVSAIQRELGEGRMPAEQLLDGLLVLLAAGLLVMPGLLTDVCGLVLLLPRVRGLARKAAAAALRPKLQAGGPLVIDARYRRE